MRRIRLLIIAVISFLAVTTGGKLFKKIIFYTNFYLLLVPNFQSVMYA